MANRSNKKPLSNKVAQNKPIDAQNSEAKKYNFPGAALLSHPYFPGVLLLLATFIIALFTYHDYGIAWDEPFQRGPGLLSYNYIFHGDPTLFLRPNDNHGAGYEIPLIILEKLFNLSDTRDIYLMRHLVTHLLFLGACFSFYILTLRLFKDRFLASLGFLILVCAPRIYAHSFFNTKDLPFLSLTIIALTFCRLAFHKNKPALFLVLGLICGYATSIRIMGIMLGVLVVLFLFVDLINSAAKKEKPQKPALNILLFCAGFCILLYGAWPYLWKSPVHNFIESFSKLSRFELWNGNVLVAGKFIKSTQLPWTYFPTWFLITVPELWLVAGFAGIVWVSIDFIKKPLAFLRNTHERNFLLYLSCFFAPIFAIIILHSIIYDDWRHLYFIYPPFVLAGLYFIHKLYSGKYKVVVRGVCVAQLALTGLFMVLNHPFNQVYFNNLVSHSPGYLRNNYEMDYWGCSFKQGLDYILLSNDSKTININCDYKDLLNNNLMLLPPEDRCRFQYTGLEGADYYMTNFRGHSIDYPSSDNVYSVSVLNSNILSVYKSEKDPAIQKKIWQTEIDYLTRSLAANRDDLDAQARIATAFLRNEQYDSAEAHYKTAMKLSPGNPDLTGSLAGVYYSKKNYPLAIETFKKMIAASKNDARPYSNIAVCFYFTGQKDSTVCYLKKAISIEPSNASLYPNLINTYQSMGNMDSAKKYELQLEKIRKQ